MPTSRGIFTPNSFAAWMKLYASASVMANIPTLLPLLLSSITDRIFLNKGDYEARITSTSASYRTIEPGNLVFYTEDNKICTIKSFGHEYLGMELNIPNLNFTSKNRAYMQFQAVDFKNLIKEALENSQLSEINSERLRLLNNEISENDNPILIHGKSLTY